mgnify:CR=1 FL=1
MKTVESKIEDFKDSKIKAFIGYSEDKNQQIAKVFEFDNTYISGSYVSLISIYTWCEIEICEFEIKLLTSSLMTA